MTGQARIRRIDELLLRAPRPVRRAVIALTLLGMVVVALPHVPRTFVDFSSMPWLPAINQRDEVGPDTIALMYVSKVILNDLSDMYTRARLDQTPLEAATWSKEASGPYPPALLLSAAALYAIGEALGVGYTGAILILLVIFVWLVLAYCVRTRWYVFPLLFGNFSYFAYRFVAVQDGTYLIMLTVIMLALHIAHRAHRQPSWAHPLMALAVTMKLSPAYYLKNLLVLPPRSAVLMLAILVTGFVLPIFIWDDYLSIYSFHEEFKGSPAETIGAVALALPFGVCLWYVETRLSFDWEDRIGWGLVPFALFLGFKMNTARHLLIVLLVPDKRGLRSACFSLALLAPVLLPGLVRFNSTLAIAAGFLVLTLVHYLGQIGWGQVRHDLSHPSETMRLLLRRRS